MMGESALVLQDVSKSYGAQAAVDGLSLDVKDGECLALVGHNGAGKTTLFKIILGLIRASEGTVSIRGHGPGDKRVRLGFLPESVVFQKSLTGQEVLGFFARLKGERQVDLEALLERVGLAGVGKKRVGNYSKGMRQRLGLAQTLIGKPDLLILDEPTSGLDPSSRRQFYQILDELRDGGATILLSSHALSEVESYTSRIAIMRDGILLADGPLSDLAREAELPVRVDVYGDRPEAGEKFIEGFAGASCDVRASENLLRLKCKAEDKISLVQRVTSEADWIKDIRIMPPTLDDIYEHYQAARPADVEGLT